MDCPLLDLVLGAQRVFGNLMVREIWLDWDHDLRGAFPSYSIERSTMEKQLEKPAEKQTFTVQERVDKFCVECDEERGHVVVSVTKRGQISRVSCPKCGTRSTFQSAKSPTAKRSPSQPGAPYDQSRTYRTGQTMVHPTYGVGEVTAVIEPQKIDVLFPDRMRRLVHARVRM